MDALDKLVMSHVPDAHPLTRAGDEESYRLPGGTTAAFSALLRALDGSSVVRTYGMQITTLEEVFIQLASTHAPAGSGKPMQGFGSGAELPPPARLPPPRETYSDGQGEDGGRGDDVPMAVGWNKSDEGYDDASAGAQRTPAPVHQPSWKRQLNALLYKRLLCVARSPLAFLIQQTLPVFFVYLVLKGVSPSASPVAIEPRPPLEMSSKIFSNDTRCVVGICHHQTIPSDLVHTPARTHAQEGLLRSLHNLFSSDVVLPEGFEGMQDSAAISEYLINTSLIHGGHQRFAALAFNDTVPVRVYADVLQIAQLRAAGAMMASDDADHREADDTVGNLLMSLNDEHDIAFNITTYADALAVIGRQASITDDYEVSTADCTAFYLTPIQCARLTERVRRFRSHIDLDNDGKMESEDLTAGLVLGADGHITFEECQRLELPRSRCISLMNITEDDYERWDINDDGEVNATDTRLYAEIFADFNLTTSECADLELEPDECTLAQSTAQLADCDGNKWKHSKWNASYCSHVTHDVELMQRNFVDGWAMYDDPHRRTRFQAIAQLNVTFSDCKRLGYEPIFCELQSKIVNIVRARLASAANASNGEPVDQTTLVDVQRLTNVLSGMLRGMVVLNPNRTERFSNIEYFGNATNVSENTAGWHETAVHVPLTIMHNASSAHAAAAALADVTAAAWKHAHHGAADATYRLVNHPLPPPRQPYLDYQKRRSLSFFLAAFLAIPMSYMPAAAGTFVTLERVCRATHVQLVSGTPASVYWLSNAIADLLAYFVSTAFIIVLFYVRSEDEFIATFEQTFATLALFMAFGASSIPVMHLLSKSFDSAPSAQIGCIIFSTTRAP